jgi:hypothetical protein
MMRFKWRYSRRGATADVKILWDCGNVSSIMPGNAPSIMVHKALPATID